MGKELEKFAEPTSNIDFFNGIENLRAAKTSTKFSYEPWQMKEIVKCSQDIIYFCEKYVTIETANGPMLWGDASQEIFVDGELKTFTGMWEFQKKFMLMMAEEQNCLAKFPRQCGKCCLGDTEITVRDSNGVEMSLTIEEFEELLSASEVS